MHVAGAMVSIHVAKISNKEGIEIPHNGQTKLSILSRLQKFPIKKGLKSHFEWAEDIEVIGLQKFPIKKGLKSASP